MRLWKRLQSALVRFGIAGLIIAFIAGIIAAAYFAALFPDWTGFGPPRLDAQGKELPYKTLWDWLGLLLIPLVLAIGGFFLTRSENRYALSLQEQREQEASLRAYLDQMTELLLHENLRTSQPDDEVRSVARAWTLTVLRVLDGERKATVVQFLYEAKLIGHIKQGVSEPIVVIVSLERANLNGANLEFANLNGANLNGVHLEMASLVGASLTEEHLEYAILAGANLKGAFLEKAHLTGANLDGANLELTNLSEAHLILASLKGASLKMAILDRARLDGGDFLDCARPDEATMLLDGTVTREQLAQTYSFEGAKLPFDMTPPALSVEASTPKEQARGRSEDAAAGDDHI